MHIKCYIKTLHSQQWIWLVYFSRRQTLANIYSFKIEFLVGILKRMYILHMYVWDTVHCTAMSISLSANKVELLSTKHKHQKCKRPKLSAFIQGIHCCSSVCSVDTNACTHVVPQFFIWKGLNCPLNISGFSSFGMAFSRIP